jgi:hypothetical protein
MVEASGEDLPEVEAKSLVPGTFFFININAPRGNLKLFIIPFLLMEHFRPESLMVRRSFRIFKSSEVPSSSCDGS